MEPAFILFFAESGPWIGRPVHFITNGHQFTGTLQRIRVHEYITDGRGKRSEARLAVFDVHVPGTFETWELNRSLYQLMCNFEQPGSRLEMTALGNVIFKSGSITGLIKLSNMDEPRAADPTEADHREPGTQHL
jgi:hypothetical protein